jgi:hypothetical protein
MQTRRISAAACLANLGRAADHIDGSGADDPRLWCRRLETSVTVCD